MNTITCTKCNAQVAKSRPTCQQCGQPNAVSKHVGGTELVFIAITVGIAMWGMATGSYFKMFGLLCLAFLIGGIVVSVGSSKKNKKTEELLGDLADFTPSQKYVAETGIAIDESRMKICLIDNRFEIPEFRVFSHRDLIACELFQDGSTVTKTVRSSQIGGALVGGLALGGIGAVIGGLSGKTKASEQVKRIDLRVTVNDTKNPLHDVNFLAVETKKEGLLSGPFYQQSLQQARHWQGLIEVLIKRADSEDRQNAQSEAKPAVSTSLADELKKLAELRQNGILTEEEFQSSKAKLLA